MTAIHSYAPRDGHGLKHDPLNAIVAAPSRRVSP